MWYLVGLCHRKVQFMLQEKEEKNIYYLFLDLPSVLTAAKLVIPHTTLSILILTLRKQKKKSCLLCTQMPKWNLLVFHLSKWNVWKQAPLAVTSVSCWGLQGPEETFPAPRNAATLLRCNLAMARDQIFKAVLWYLTYGHKLLSALKRG